MWDKWFARAACPSEGGALLWKQKIMIPARGPQTAMWDKWLARATCPSEGGALLGKQHHDRFMHHGVLHKYIMILCLEQLVIDVCIIKPLPEAL